MVINREFFFRGWLPAGLLINARLITSSPANSRIAVLKPIINPYPGKGWSSVQPAPPFPIEQATEDTAIVLADPFPEGALAITLTPEWLGSGTPYLLAVNTWYEGRIRSVSGSDVMGIRIAPTAYEEYFSYYSGQSVKNVRVFNMPCYHILGRNTEQVLLIDSDRVSAEELGASADVVINDVTYSARVVNLLSLSSLAFAGQLSAYKEQNPGSEIHVIQCTVTDGKLGGKEPEFIGLVAAPKASRQQFYLASSGDFAGSVDVIGNSNDYVTVARDRSWAGVDQVVHFN